MYRIVLFNKTFASRKLLLLCSFPASVFLADDPSESVPEFESFLADHVRLLPGPVPHAVAGLQTTVDDVGLVANDRFC